MTRLVIFDFETTSAEPLSARAVQFAAIAVDTAGDQWEVVDKLNVLCNPGCEIEKGAAEVHGITTEMVKDAPRDYEVVGKFVEDWLHKHSGMTLALAGHNSSTFDQMILERLAREAAVAVPDLPHLDTLVCATRLWPDAPSFKLSQNAEEAAASEKKKFAEAVRAGKKPAPMKTGNALPIGLIQWLGLGSGDGAHDALADVLMVRDLIRRIQYETEASLLDLAEWCAVPHVLETCHFGKHAGKKWGKGPGRVPWAYVKFMTEKFTEASRDMQATCLYHYNLRYQFEGAMQDLIGCQLPEE